MDSSNQCAYTLLTLLLMGQLNAWITQHIHNNIPPATTSVQPMCDELEVRQLRACDWVGVVRWLPRHAQHGTRPPGTAQRAAADPLKL
jgi:hypothetical protein